MHEIELKARVYDRERVIRILNSFADYRGIISKYDSYWKQELFFLPIRPAEEEHKGTTLRIRIEKSESVQEPVRTLVTCKQKNAGGYGKEPHKRSGLEVNEESEFGVSDGAAFEELIMAAGFSPFLTKHKRCMQWHYEDMLIELCTVDDLGDFLEIETVREERGDVEEVQTKMEKLLEKCEIPLAQIEPMYYSELSATHTSAAGKIET
ncbi:CYTH domain-containing protein [Treponema sp. HNW]|uniref:CYTH domain-containing protein n=1 Tax=Treponema sp. HNW TaxID=3116654 RepID=UPI003D0B9E32